MSTEKTPPTAPRACDCYAAVLEAVRDIDKNIGGTELARMPVDCAKRIVILKKWIQDGDVYAMEDTEHPWPSRDVLGKLVEAAETLMNQYSYDGHGYEQITEAVKRAKEMIA